MTLKQSPGHQTYNENVDLEQDYNHAKFERFGFDSVQEKGNIKVGFFFLSNEEICQLFPLSLCQNTKNNNNNKKTVYSWFTWCDQQSYKVSTYPNKKMNISVKTVWHCCDLEIPSRPLKVASMGRAQWELPSGKFDIYHIQSIRENRNVNVFATYGHLAGRPQHRSLHYICHVSQKW